jgi:hypothetical protein
VGILQTTNPTWGFYGEFNYRATDPSVAWPLAMEAIGKATGCPAKRVKNFLESCKGRLFAEAVIILMSENFALKTAIDAAVERWMYLKTRPEDQSDYGIQVGLPYLTGFACYCELKADTGEGRVTGGNHPSSPERPKPPQGPAREASR